MPVRDFFAVVLGLNSIIIGSLKQPNLPEEIKLFLRAAQPILKVCVEHGMPAVWNALHAAVIVPLVAHSRLDSRLLVASPSSELTATQKTLVRMNVRAIEPQIQHVELDGSERPVMRVGTGNEWDDVRWVSWDGEVLGRAETGRQIPVYIQSHGLRQLHARVRYPSVTPYLEHWLYESLKNPRIVERTREDLLVEYRIQQDRLGYLIVTPLADCAVVRTFKFLTMENTPEARLLNKELRLTRRDVDWLGLQEMSAFTQTDLGSDPVLRPIMERCGCGHLFELSKMSADEFAPKITPQPRALAAEMKKYLRMAA
jgi:hypothetical protein